MSDRRLAWLVRAALALPFVVALVALATSHWTPVLDLAMTELRVRDVFGTHTPLIGLPGRIGTFPDQGSHPGPLSFYLLAPVYRALGSTSYALLVSTAAINVVAAWTAVWVAGRRGGRRLVLAVGALLAVLLAWLGASVLTQPWNPYLPLVSFMVVLLATWGVIDGDRMMLLPLVGFATLCAQTHVPYLLLDVALCCVAFGSVVLRWWRQRPSPPAARPLPARMYRSWVLRSIVLGAVLWLPVLVDEVRHAPGNITMLRRHFLSPPEQPVGLVVGAKTVLAHFDLAHIVAGSATGTHYSSQSLDDLAGGGWLLGAVVLLAWCAAAACSLRLADRRIVRLHLVVAVGTALAFLSTARIFGKLWYYLTLWSWSIALLAAAATIWTAVAWWEQAGRRTLPVARASLVVLLAAIAVFVRDAATVGPPEASLSRSLGAVVEPTAAALAAGVGAADGARGVYLVVWADAYYFGSQGYGLLNELERRGFDARATDTYRVPVTAHRTIAAPDATAEVVLATGLNVELWRARPGAIEVAFFEPRDADQLAEFHHLRDDAIALLRAANLDDIVATIDTNLFGARVDPRLPAGVEPMLARMLVLGEETAVFIAPAGTW
jgi:hypothetical protein